jgi:hypothetical protein
VANLKDILNEDDDLRDEDLLKYVQENLSREEEYKVEKQIADSDFVSDAVEGLQSIQNKRSIEQYVDELNRQLRKQVSVKKRRKEKRKWKEERWIIISVVIVLLLCILAYAVVRYNHKESFKAGANGTEQKE